MGQYQIFLKRSVYLLPPLIVWAMVFCIVAAAWQDLQFGGNEWKQGDWLINNSGGVIRRGILGSMILWIADITRANPVLVTVIVQVSLLLACVCLLILSLKNIANRHTFWLLVISPGFFINLWAVDTQGGLRKELIVFLAFAFLLFAVTRKQFEASLAYFSAGIFGIAVLGHEGNVFFLPSLWFCYVALYKSGKVSCRTLVRLCVITAIASGVSIGIALIFGHTASTAAICQPLFEADVRAGICDGAIQALTLRASEYLGATAWILLSPKLFHFLLMYVLSSFVILFIAGRIFGYKETFKYFVLSAVPFAPLYILAIDWGRWLSFHITSFVFAMLILFALQEKNNLDKATLSTPLFIIIILYSTVWGTSHFVYINWGGILYSYSELSIFD